MRRKNNRLLLGVFFIVLIMTGCSGNYTGAAGDPIVIACGDDTAGMLVRMVVDDYPGAAEQEVEAEQVGDCCGSNSQFALSTGEVGIAVVCPDAVQFLPDGGKDYAVAGTVVYDANVLVRKYESQETPASIGYMNNRKAQVDLLKARFGDDAELKQMYASGLSYALENEAVDAVVLDAMTALALGYPYERLSRDEPSAVMVVNRELLDDERFLGFIESYNAEVNKLNDSSELTRLLERYLEQGGTKIDEEVLSRWQEMGVRFAQIQIEE